MSPENNDMDLDFTKPGALPGMEVKEDYASIEDKVAELQNNIAATERGIALAQSLNDPERLAQMTQKKEEFEATLAMLQQEKKPEPAKNEDDAFSRAVGDEFGGALNKMEKRGF
jgi:hypothetical protein